MVCAYGWCYAGLGTVRHESGRHLSPGFSADGSQPLLPMTANLDDVTVRADCATTNCRRQRLSNLHVEMLNPLRRPPAAQHELSIPPTISLRPWHANPRIHPGIQPATSPGPAVSQVPMRSPRQRARATDRRRCDLPPVPAAQPPPDVEPHRRSMSMSVAHPSAPQGVPGGPRSRRTRAHVQMPRNGWPPHQGRLDVGRFRQIQGRRALNLQASPAGPGACVRRALKP